MWTESKSDDALDNSKEDEDGDDDETTEVEKAEPSNQSNSTGGAVTDCQAKVSIVMYGNVFLGFMNFKSVWVWKVVVFPGF